MPADGKAVNSTKSPKDFFKGGRMTVPVTMEIFSDYI
jgi:hypothetical protein